MDMEQKQSILTVTMNPVIDQTCEVDHVAPEMKLRCGPPTYNAGGGGINVSRAIRKLGGDSIALYPVGGFTGQFFEELLEREGVRRWPVRIEQMTRENLVVDEAYTGHQFRFGLPGPSMKPAEWQSILDHIRSVEPKPDYIVASGSLPLGVPDDFYAQVARIGKGMGARIVVDTSDEPLRLAVEEGVFMIKPNFREVRQLIGPDKRYEFQLEDAAKQLVDDGKCEIVAISLGAAGALGVSKEGCFMLRPPAVPVRSKIGAGDTMVAGIVLSLARGWSLRDALRFGVATGTATVMRSAAELCRRADAERIFERTIAEPCEAVYSPDMPAWTVATGG